MTSKQSFSLFAHIYLDRMLLPGACVEGGHGVAPAPLKKCCAPPTAQTDHSITSLVREQSGCILNPMRCCGCHTLIDSVASLEVEPMRRTHLLTVWFAGNQFPNTMPLDQSAVNYTAQKGEVRFRMLQTTSFCSL